MLVGRAQLINAATNHVWLQVRQGDRWLDLDPTSLESVPGVARGTLLQTVSGLSDDLYHRLSINVRIEERTAGRHSNRLLLQSDWRTADLSGSTITLGFAEPLGLNPVATAPPHPRIRAVIPRYSSWTTAQNGITRHAAASPRLGD